MKASTRKAAGFWLLFSLPLLWTLVFLILPYGAMGMMSFWTRKFPLFVLDFQWGNYIILFSDPQYLTVILRTLKIAGLVTVYSVLLGYPLAYFLVFTIRRRRLRTPLYMCVVVPLWVSYLLRAYTWKIILGTDGALNSALLWLGLVDQPLDIFLYNQAAMVITLTYIFIPFMVMPDPYRAGTHSTRVDRGLAGSGSRTFRDLHPGHHAPVHRRCGCRRDNDVLPVSAILSRQCRRRAERHYGCHGPAEPVRRRSTAAFGSALAVVIFTLVLIVLQVSSRSMIAPAASRWVEGIRCTKPG